MMKKITDDKRVFYWACLIVTLIILFRPIGLPIIKLQTSIDAYNYVDSVPEGSTVLYAISMSPGNYGELNPVNIAAINHLFSKNMRIIFMATGAQSVLMKDMMWPKINDDNKVYGIDYVDMGFVAGAESAIASLGRDIRSTFRSDRDGTDVDDLEIFNGVNDAYDIDLVMITTGGETDTQFINQWVTVYDSNVVVMASSGVFPLAQMNYNAGLLKGALNGLRAGADYEALTRKPGAAIKLMDLQSALHLVLLGFLVIGNIQQFTQKR